MDHTNSECLLIAVMSHGEDGRIYAKDRTYQTKKLWSKFSPLHCQSLAGKPKLFFIQVIDSIFQTFLLYSYIIFRHAGETKRILE